MLQPINIFWFRRDLRLHDNAALFHALSSGIPVLPIFIFDRFILDELEDRSDRRVNFIYAALQNIQLDLKNQQSSLLVQYGFPKDVFEKLILEYNIQAVFTNHDYEPYATERDEEIKKLLSIKNIQFKTFKDQVIFEKDEIKKDEGSHYTVYTPYSKKWLASFNTDCCKAFNSETLRDQFLNNISFDMPSLEEMNFIDNKTLKIQATVDESIITEYQNTRNFPAVEGTSRIGVHLRFGTISVRQLIKQILPLNETFLKELIWREFFMHLLWHKPQLVNRCYKPEYENIQWNNNEEEFERWCRGTTGYPIVDAGMRQLNETGFMHNRVRMIAASFVVKHLLVDWRWGEAYFAKKLLDFELASNNGNWQWVAGCGCDAAPYFRIFNPAIQTQKFDVKEEYIKKWVPEYKDKNYPSPIIQHEWARQRCLAEYKKALSSKYF